MSIKRSAADAAFSDAVRAAADYTCAWCGIQKLPTGRRGGSGMELSHRYSRRHKNIRYDTLNADCLCTGCHRKFGESPIEAMDWLLRTAGAGQIELLIEKKNTIAKVSKAEEKEIAKHYREQLKIVEAKRAAGLQGPIEIESYQ